MPTPTAPRSPWMKRYAVPTAHGSWTWWIGPVAIGVAAGGHPRWNVLSLVLAALAAFLLLQPVTIAIKAYTGRRKSEDLRPALVWIAIYLLVATLGVACLVAGGHAVILGLAAPGVFVFGWYLALVARRSERRQMLVEVLAAATMALGAPAAYWVAGGVDYPEPWILWLLTWMPSAAAIVHVYLRLEQRAWKKTPSLAARFAAGRASLAANLGALGVATALVVVHAAPPLVVAAYAVNVLDAIEGTVRPCVGAKPKAVGIRQLTVWAVYVVVMVLAYLTR